MTSIKISENHLKKIKALLQHIYNDGHNAADTIDNGDRVEWDSQSYRAIADTADDIANLLNIKLNSEDQ